MSPVIAKLKKLWPTSPAATAYWFLVVIVLIPFLFSLLFQRQREEDFIFIFINAAILLSPLYLLKNHRLYFALLFPLIFLPALIDFIHIFLYQGRITSSIFFIIFDTNPAESVEYIDSNISWGLVLSTCFYLAVTFWSWMKVLRLEKIELKTKWYKYIALWMVLPFVLKLATSKGDLNRTFEAYRRSSQLFSMVYGYSEYRAEMANFDNFNSTVQKNLPVTRTAEVPKQEVHVLIVGESTTSAKMSLYGYQRKTTPKLEAMKNDLFVFRDVLSAFPPSTQQNLKKIMTLASSEQESPELLGINLVNIMKSSGFKTYWLSNQLVIGSHDTITTVFARQSDSVMFMNTSNSITFDEKIFPHLDRYLAEPVDKKFIVIHLLGTHMKYRQRYPSEFDVFKDDVGIKRRPFHTDEMIQYINEYDNSVLYHDHVLSQIFQRLKLVGKYSSVTFLSDHGEEVYDEKKLHGHPPANPTINMFKIPMLMWLSPELKSKMRPEYLDRKYVSDDIIHTLMDLYDIQIPQYEVTKSILAPEFVEKKRYIP